MNPFTLPKLYDAEGDMDSQWYVFYHFKNPDTGKNQRIRTAISRALKTKSDRYQKAAEIKSDLKKKLLSGYDPFVQETKKSTNCIVALNYALKYKCATTGKRTQTTYSSIIGMFITWLKANRLNGKSIEILGRNVAENYADYMIMELEISNRTFNNRLQVLRTIFNFLKKKTYVDFSPFEFVEYLKEDEAEISAFTRKELKLIGEKLPGYHYPLYVISQLIFYCFIRPQELVRLQFEDILWDDGIIKIPGHKSKNGNSEVIVLPKKLIENLRGWNRGFPPKNYIFSRGKMLIPGTKEIAPTRISEVWREFANENGITKNIYDMKHTGNGMAVDSGINIRDIQLQNRHHSLEQTQKYLNKFRRKAGSEFVNNFEGY